MVSDNEKIENVINFYMKANCLKYELVSDLNQSVADHIYGALILATAINSEYEKGDNLGKIIQIILLEMISKYEKLSDFGKSNVNCWFHQFDVGEYLDFGNKDGCFAFDCVVLECSMTYFFERFLIEENLITESIDILPLEEYIKVENINKFYNFARGYGFIDRFGSDDRKNYEIFRFYYLNRVLKKKVRSGWDSTHWNVSSDRIERVSEHIVGTIALALGLALEFPFPINLYEVLETLTIHEIGEIIIGDQTPFDGMTSEEKKEIEERAMREIVGNLSNKSKMLNSLFEFDNRETENAKFSHYCDKLEADIQSKVYQDMDCHHPLDNQENNVVFRSPKVQKLVEDGATTAFDIWYEWDKSIYEEASVFARTLRYVKNTKLK